MYPRNETKADSIGLGAGCWRSLDEANPHRGSGLVLCAPSKWLGFMPGGRYYALLPASSFRRSGSPTL